MDLSSLSKPSIKAPMLTIVGTPGSGKTSLGGLFPSPVFIQAEEGASVFESWDDDVKPMLFPPLPRAKGKDGKLAVSTKDAMLDQLRALGTQDHQFKTVVIDAVTSLHAAFEHEVCVASDADNIGDACGGYGKGFLAVKEMHGEIKNACDYLKNAKGMTVVFLAHAGIRKVKNSPDAPEYSVYSLDMHEASIQVYTNLVDGVYYLRQEDFIKGAETDKKGKQVKYGKIVQTGNRILVTSGDGRVGYVNAKSRYPLDAEIPVEKGENPLLELIPFFKK